jgi:hypothetical protein
MAKKLKQGSLTIPPISTKRTTTCHLKSLNIKLTTVLEIQIMAWNRQKNVSKLNWLGFFRPDETCLNWNQHFMTGIDR